MSKFKIGDKVKVVECSGFFGPHGLKIGEVYEIGDEYFANGFILKAKGIAQNYVHEDEIELYKEHIYEDQWHLNDGKVTIPDDADKLEKDGSVVAFRKCKAKPFAFGEKLRIKKSLWPLDIVGDETNPGFDYVNAVYLCKYFDLEGEEGITVYIDDGEKGWECHFNNLSKVERLT